MQQLNFAACSSWPSTWLCWSTCQPVQSTTRRRQFPGEYVVCHWFHTTFHFLILHRAYCLSCPSPWLWGCSVLAWPEPGQHRLCKQLCAQCQPLLELGATWFSCALSHWDLRSKSTKSFSSQTTQTHKQLKWITDLWAANEPNITD